MKPLSKLTATFTDSVIRRMTRVANAHGAINLSQGFPDFDPPRGLMDRLAKVAYAGPHQYAVTWGAQNFRDLLAKKQERYMGIEVNPDSNIVVTCGSTEAMMCAVRTVCDPGESVVVFSPFYENYSADAILCEARPIFVKLTTPGFKLDVPALEKACAQPGCKAIILCNPSNPCGKVFSRDELLEIARLAQQYDLYVITDEVYEHIVYEPHVHTYFAALPGMKERTISCSSLSKTYHITGWRLGYIIAPAEICEVAKKVHDYLTVGAPAPLMEAAVAGLEMPDSYYGELNQLYTQKRNMFCAGLREAGMRYTEPEGAYYVMCDISELGYSDDIQMAYDMAQYVGVAGVPGSCFFPVEEGGQAETRFIRFHFAKSEAVLSEALEKLQGWKEKMAAIPR